MYIELYKSEKITVELFQYVDDISFINVKINETGEIRQFRYNDDKYKKNEYPENYKKYNKLYVYRRAITEAIKVEKEC